MDFLRKLGQQLAELVRAMPPARRFALLALTALLLAALGGIWYWVTQAEYGVLYSGLSPEDAGAITAKLQAQGASYRLGAGGTTVLVPSEQIAQRRIEMALEGLPIKGSKGFELFDSTPLGTTPFTQHVNYLRALQGELAKTITQIDPIVFARVHIVRPDPSPFIRDQKPTTASVMVRLRPGAAINRNVAAGIVAFVSHSVEGLAPENVTIVDASGHLVSDAHANESGAITTQLEYRREMESYLASKAETMLAQVLGPGRAIVRVTADINFQKLKQRKESYNPEGRVITSEMITSAKTSPNSGAARAPAGVTANQQRPTPPPAPGAPGAPDRDVTETTKTEFAVSKITQELEEKYGDLERLTIAAMIDLSGDAGKGAPGGRELSLADAQDIIKQAVGFKNGRDEMKVTDVKLSPPVLAPTGEAENEQGQTWQYVITLVRNASFGLAALVTLTLGWMMLRRLRPAEKPSKEPTPAPAEAATLPMLAALERNPDAIAKVLSNWLEQSGRQGRAAA